MKCGRCRRNLGTLIAVIVEVPSGKWETNVCGGCKKSFDATFPEMMAQWKRGALYIKDERLFLADGGTYGGILR